MGKKTNFKTSLVMSLFLLAIVSTAGAEIIYVDADASTGGDGTTWGKAYKYLQDALDSAEDGNDIWVAEGTYKPDANSANQTGTMDRDDTFKMINGVGLYGGFPTGGGDWSQRDPNQYETVLSGEIAIPDWRSDNSFHVVTATGCDANAIIDGFTIQFGYANDAFPHNRGAGIYCDLDTPTIRNCTFVSNIATIWYGGAIYGCNGEISHCTFRNNGANRGGALSHCDGTIDYCTFTDNSSQVGGAVYHCHGQISNCVFSGNSAGQSGGALGNCSGISDCIFTGNSASGSQYCSGGAMYACGTISGCTISGNWATGTNYSYGGGISGCNFLVNCDLSYNSARSGGGLYNMNSSPTIVNCRFIGNTATNSGGGIFNGGEEADPTITNCVFVDNSAAGGGAMLISEGDPNLVNCTFTANTAGSDGGALWMNGAMPILTNSVFWANNDQSGMSEASQIYHSFSLITINNCCVQGWTGGLGGTGNIGDDPRFVDPPDNLRLIADSNCIDTGNNSAVPSAVTTDLDGRPRIVDGDGNLTALVDMGAYEFNWAYIGDFDGEYDVDFADFAIFASAWQTEPADILWNQDCDIRIPADDYIDWSDLDVFSDFWLARARFSPIPHLLFSEYVEGSGFNQAVEIYNAGDVEVYLVACQVRIYSNGSLSPIIVPLNAVTLAPSEVFVLGHPGIAVPASCDQLSAALAFSGNDAIELVYQAATHDVIGQIGFNPGPLGWGSGGNTTTDHTLRRNCSVSTGDSFGYDSFDPAVEWEAFPINTFDGLGDHCQ